MIILLVMFGNGRACMLNYAPFTPIYTHLHPLPIGRYFFFLNPALELNFFLGLNFLWLENF